VSHSATKQRAGRIRVFVVGPHALFNEALCALLAGLPGIELVGQAEDLAALPTPLPEIPPDLVLLACPQPADLERLPTFRRQHPPMRVLCLALTWTLDRALVALQAGAIGCLSADVTADELAVALRQAVRGDVTLSPDLARDLIARLAEDQPLPAASYESLTPREQELLKLVCQGLSNKKIAQHLFLSVRTVENHLANIYGKLGVRSRTEAAVLALQQGWHTGTPV
jgi:DNA-binding NarL/FixJ family response regulator